MHAGKVYNPLKGSGRKEGTLCGRLPVRDERLVPFGQALWIYIPPSPSFSVQSHQPSGRPLRVLRTCYLTTAHPIRFGLKEGTASVTAKSLAQGYKHFVPGLDFYYQIIPFLDICFGPIPLSEDAPSCGFWTKIP
jgi:hypothetical protein